MKAAKLVSTEFPSFGAEWQGGMYAGIARGDDGNYYHLIVGPEAPNRLTHADAVAWAEKLRDGKHSDWTLPDRFDQPIMFANLPEIRKPNFYWSRTQHADVSDYAWGQYFGYGDQDSWHKGGGLRARAVRRLPIGSFANSFIRSKRASKKAVK